AERPGNRPAGPADQKDSRLSQLLKERLAALRALAEMATNDYRTGKVSFDRVQQAVGAVLRAELELSESDKERVTILEKMVTQAKGYEDSALERYRAGAVSQSEVLMARAARLEAEIALERMKARTPARPK